MILLRIALLGALFSASVYSMDTFHKTEQQKAACKLSKQFPEYYALFTERAEYNGGLRYGSKETEQLAVFHAMTLIHQKNMEEIAQQQLQATHEQNTLIAALLAKLSISSHQATSATVTPSAPPASPKVGAARAANQMPPDYKSAAK